MIWLLVLIALCALSFTAYAMFNAGGIAERQAERILRDLQADEARRVRLGDQHPYRIHR